MKFIYNPLSKNSLSPIPEAEDLDYDNTISGLSASNIKVAIDELASGVPIQSNYLHNQNILSHTWNINHNLNRYTSVTIIDNIGNIIEGDILFIDLNNITIIFKKAGVNFQIIGKAYLT
jgi:hypothetical protein